MLDILFIDPCDKPELRQEVNGTLLLGTRLLEAGFSVDILRFWQIPSYRVDHGRFVEELAERILEISPKCVSFYSLWPQYHTVILTARLLKQRDPSLTVVFGGPQPSATAVETMTAIEAVDYICSGEGENTVVPFFEALLRQNGQGLDKVPGLCRRQNGEILANELDVPLKDLDTLPRWDERLYQTILEIPEPHRTAPNYWMGLDVGRGCPFSCTFCSSSRFWRRTYRMKSPSRIVDDMEYFINTFGIHSFSFAHDAFTVNKKLAAAVCDEILSRGLQVTWKCTTRVDCIDEELIVKMKQAGLQRIELGVETGSPRMQALIRKNLDPAQVRHVVKLLQKHKIRVVLLFMYGFPEETEEDLAQTLDLMFDLMDSGVDRLNLSYCHFSPGTDMTRRHFDDLVIDPEIKMLERTVWGHADGDALFRQHKELFPFRYHLHTPVRDRYQYLHFLVMLYLFLPRSARFLRELYGSDGLGMYRDLYDHNRQYLDQGYERMEVIFKQQPLTLVENMLRDHDPEVAKRMLELVRFDIDLWRVSHGGDTVLRQVYGFNYIDFTRNKPVSRFTPGSTELLLQKKDGKTELQVLRFLM